MASLAQKIECEQRVRELLEDGGLPDPDRVEYGRGCIRLFWRTPAPGVCVVVDIEEQGDSGQADAGQADAGQASAAQASVKAVDPDAAAGH